LELVSDAKLPRGSAIFETSRGDLDASIDTQLLEIERGFTDIIRRRPV
jgi:flagellar assembly protein FliH